MKNFYLSALILLASIGGAIAQPCVTPAPWIDGQRYDLCSSKIIEYTAGSVGGLATTYNWTVPSGFTILSGQGTYTVSVKTPAIFTSAQLKVSATSSCGTSSQTSITLVGAPGDLSMAMKCQLF